MGVRMSQGLGDIERKILERLNAEGGYINTARLARLVYGRAPTQANITYTLYALNLLAKAGRVHGVRGRPYIWTTNAEVLGRNAREKRIRRRKRKTAMERKDSHQRLQSYRPTGRPTRRNDLPGQKEFSDLYWIPGKDWPKARRPSKKR